MTGMPKIKPFRSKKAIMLFRGLPCAVCGSRETTGHHEPLNGHGMASKGPDDEQIPLCFKCHRLRHDAGRYTFYSLHGMDWRAEVKKYQVRCREALNL